MTQVVIPEIIRAANGSTTIQDIVVVGTDLKFRADVSPDRKTLTINPVTTGMNAVDKMKAKAETLDYSKVIARAVYQAIHGASDV